MTSQTDSAQLILIRPRIFVDNNANRALHSEDELLKSTLRIGARNFTAVGTAAQITACVAVIALVASMGSAGTARRSVTLMIVVDRSGSVQRSRSDAAIRHALLDFIDTFEDVDNIIGLGSFGGSWKLDFPPASGFRSGEVNLAKAIRELPFTVGATNTAEALYQTYAHLSALGKTESLNGILLITDGRPSAFTATFNLNRSCELNDAKTGFIAATIGPIWPPLPPQRYGERGIYTLGLFKANWTPSGDFAFIDSSAGCHYFTDTGQPIVGASFHLDFSTFPEADAHGNATTGPVYALGSRSTADPRAVRFASFNAADNMATTIRQDKALRIVLWVVGLNEPLYEEPLDAAWLARLANDPFYRDNAGKPVFQPSQTAGKYYNVSPATLGPALQTISQTIHLISEGRNTRPGIKKSRPSRKEP